MPREDNGGRLKGKEAKKKERSNKASKASSEKEKKESIDDFLDLVLCDRSPTDQFGRAEGEKKKNRTEKEKL